MKVIIILVLLTMVAINAYLCITNFRRLMELRKELKRRKNSL
jgi:hypothetical protein